jgi:hypothetical protein
MNPSKGVAMKVLMLALAAAGLALAVSACGSGGATFAGPAPSIPVETAPPATSSGGTADLPTEQRDQIVEYVAQADAICKTAIDKIEAAIAALPEGYAYEDLRFIHYEVSGEALAELRALPLPETEAVNVNPVALCSHRGGSQESASGPTRAEFVAQAEEICRAAESRIHEAESLIHESWLPPYLEAGARIMEEALAQLRAVPQPEADRALLEEGFYEVMEQEIYAVRRWGAALSAGDDARALLLEAERVHLTHQREPVPGKVYGMVSCVNVGVGGR